MSEMWRRKPIEGYNWFFLDLSSAWGISLLFTLVVLALAIGLFILNIYLSDDLAPDSFLGYTYAIVGTLSMFLAVLGYSRYRRSHKRDVGRLNRSLHWHVSFGIIALGLLFLHSFGNFNPRSGTYALYGMVALVISGIIGRFLDRIVPKLIAHDLKSMLAECREGRVELDTHATQSTISHNKQESRRFQPQEKVVLSKVAQPTKSVMIPWDLAYVSLEETSQELGQKQAYRSILPDYEGNPDELVTAMPGVEKHSDELPDGQGAFHREEYYLAIIRYWRVGHIVLAFLALGLTLWHLEYVATLLLPMYFK
jgi:hypothetical protein